MEWGRFKDYVSENAVKLVKILRVTFILFGFMLFGQIEAILYIIIVLETPPKMF
jgi:phage shock protein PspC (stress-responsive transcriptional regulator)